MTSEVTGSRSAKLDAGFATVTMMFIESMLFRPIRFNPGEERSRARRDNTSLRDNVSYSSLAA